MRTKFKTYLTDINKTGPIIQHIEQIYKEYKILIGNEEIIDIFLCEEYNKENIKIDTSLIFFTKESVLESKNFLLNNRDLDYTKYLNKIQYYNIEYSDYDLIEYDEKSYVKLYVRFKEGLRLELTATGKNCKYLLEILDKYIKPNII